MLKGFFGIVLSISVAGAVMDSAAQIPQQANGSPEAQADTGAGAVSADRLRTDSDIQAALPAESIGRNDLLDIRVPYCPELSGKFRVAADGTLALPLLPAAVQVAGLTPVQVSTKIREAVIAQQIMPDPSVNVSVLEYRSRTVIILGAVAHPLNFQATGDLTLLDAIAMAGGLTPDAGSTITVISPQINSHGTMERVTHIISVQDLVTKDKAEVNLPLHGGEEIRVAEAGKIFVTGNVVHPGMYVMQGDQSTTVLKALALSQGLQSYSSGMAYIYRRSTTAGDRQEIQVQLSRIMSRKEQDVPLVADDILYVPEAKGKRLTARVLNQITGFGETAGAGVLIYR